MRLDIDSCPARRNHRIQLRPTLFAVLAWIGAGGLPANAQTPTAPPPPAAQWQSLSSGNDEAANPQVAVVGFNSDVVAETEIPPVAELSKEAIQQELSAVESSTELAPEMAAEIKERLRKAATWLDAEAAAKKRQLELEALLPQTPAKLTDVRAALANFAEAEFNTLPAGNTIVELEAQLASLRQQLESEDKAYREREAEVEGRTTRLAALAKEVVETEEKIVKLKTQSEALKPTDLSTKSQSIELRARLRLREQELITAKLERRRLEEIAELLPLQRDLAKRIWNNRQKMLARWQTAIDTWRKEESKRQAEVARRMVENAHPALKSLAEENALIAETRLLTAAEIQRLTASIKRLTDQSKQIAEDFKELSDRVEHAGTTSTTGLLLRKKRSELPSVAEFVTRATFVQATMPAAHLQLMEWKRQRAEVEDPEDASRAMIQSLDASLAEADPDQVMKVLIRLLTDRRALLEKAIPDQNTLLEDLNQLELVNQNLRESSCRVSPISQSASPLDSQHRFDFAGRASRSPRRSESDSGSRDWQETVRVGGLAMLRRPAVGLAVLAMFALLLAFRARMHSSQKKMLQPPNPGQPTAYRNYFGAFLISVALSTRWPTLLLPIGYRLRIAADSFTWTENVGVALVTSVAFFWVCELIRELCRRDSVGERAFGWPAKATAAVRSTLELTIMAGIPLFALLQLTQFGEVDQMQGLQRVLFIAVLSLLGVQLAWLTRPGGVLMRCLSETSPKSMVVRFRHTICVVVTCAPLALVILSMIGYHFSAYQLSRHLAETGAVLVATIVLYSLALCWISVVSYNRALQDPTEQDPAEQETTEHPGQSAPQGETSVAGSVVTEQVAISTTEFYSKVGDEVRDLLRYACWILLLVSGWFIWSEVLPALRVFDHVVMWQSIEPVAETFHRCRWQGFFSHR